MNLTYVPYGNGYRIYKDAAVVGVVWKGCGGWAASVDGILAGTYTTGKTRKEAAERLVAKVTKRQQEVKVEQYPVAKGTDAELQAYLGFGVSLRALGLAPTALSAAPLSTSTGRSGQSSG